MVEGSLARLRKDVAQKIDGGLEVEEFTSRARRSQLQDMELRVSMKLVTLSIECSSCLLFSLGQQWGVRIPSALRRQNIHYGHTPTSKLQKLQHASR